MMYTSSNSALTPLAPLWHFLYARRDAAEELAFRKHYLDADIRQVSAIIYSISALMIALTAIDVYDYLFKGTELLLGAGLRIAFVILGMALIWWMKSARRPAAVDWSTIIFPAGIAAGAILYHLVNDSSPTRIVAVITIFILISHVAFPTYAITVLLPICVLLLGESFVLINTQRLDTIELRPFIFVVAVFIEIAALVASTYHLRTRFQSYQAMQKVKQLTGLLPICASCKSIRDDHGYYQQLESYITEHSEAVFSHSICPDCKDDLYPEIITVASNS